MCGIMKDAQFTWRKVVTIEDAERVCALVHATGKFSAEEIAIAGELVKERVQRGPASGYEFVLVEGGAALLGYACFGPIPGSDISYDLYWIAVVPERQGEG